MTAIHQSDNAAIFEWDGEFDLPRYDRISEKDFEPAFEKALAEHLDEIDAIAEDPAEPTFENVIVALEMAGKKLHRAGSVFWNLTASHTNKKLQALEMKLAPKMAEHQSKISMNQKLFERIDALYELRDELKLDSEAARVLEQHWKGFVRSGAKLGADEQKQLAELDRKLASHYTSFSQNVLADESSYHLIIEDEKDLKSLPEFLVSNMAAAAAEKGLEGKHVVTLSRSIIVPFLTFSDNRELRETAFRAWTGRGTGEHNNVGLTGDIVKWRAQKANLLGYENYATYKLEDTMAKTPENVTNLLGTVWKKALSKAGKEADELSSIISEEGKNHPIAPWDWRYYAEKVRERKYDFDESEVKSYFQLDKMIEAAFETANRLFGLRFIEHKSIPTWHPDVRVFEVVSPEGNRVAVFMADYFARESKRSGAWMSGLQTQHKLDGGQIPFIMNTMNFAKAPKGQPVLISLEDAKTLFHEFGHALHGMLSDVTYPSVAGTNVSRDWVELPSQLFEHWLMQPEVLEKFAVHHETGKPIPGELVSKLKAAENFDSGFDNVEFTASALVDMRLHELNAEAAGDVDPMAFQQATLDELGLPESIVTRHAVPHFGHVFSGDGYSAGYYSYMWSGVLDSDAFRAFEETGNVFDPEIAKRLKKHVFSSGDSIDPEVAYVAFRGALPTPDALLEKRGLA